MIIDAYATDTVPSHEVRRRANEALAAAGEPMSEVTYDALRKRIAELEARADRNAAGYARVDAEARRAEFLHKQKIAAMQQRVAELEAALRDVLPYVDTCNSSHREAQAKGYAALEGGKS